MQVVAHWGRLSRLAAGSAGAALAVIGVAALGRSLLRARRRRAPAAAPAIAPDDSGARAELTAQVARLQETNFRLESAIVFKNDLTSMLTHDVAQPISSIASLAELLREDWADLPDDIRLELATKIDKNTQRLIKMMNDLQVLFRLDMSTIAARQAPVPLHEAVASIASADDVEIRIHDELAVLADRAHLTAAIRHLVDNALAYGEKPVSVHAERLGEQVRLVVQDAGPGIAADLLPNLFGRQVRARGLGLFIVRNLVEANGGSIRYEPVEPHGAGLVLTLEAAPI